MTAHDRIRDIEQPGWNAGYLCGEQERLILAAECSNLRNDLRELRAQLRQLTAKETS